MGATINVTTTTDEVNTNNQCSLREAIINANTDSQTGSMDCAEGSGADTIVLQSGQTYTLSLDAAGGHATDPGASDDDLDIMSEITIQVQGNGSATIRRDPTLGCNPNGTAEKGEFRIFEVTDEGNLTLKNVTVRNGCADGDNWPHDSGGGILNDGGTVAIINSTISGNRAEDGGGIRSDGTATVMGSILSQNTAGDEGGGIMNDDSLILTNSTITQNTALNDGGGISNICCGAKAEITNSTISGNTANSNDGGGIINGPEGIVTITNSTISGNSANEDGGGIANKGTMTITNTTVSQNHADEDGGGIQNFGTVELSFVTIASNSANKFGGGITTDDTALIKNSIVGDNTASIAEPNCSRVGGTFTASGTNLATVEPMMGTSCGTTNFTYVLSTGMGGLNLGSLANNGGPTETHALLAGGVAIDAVTDCTDLSDPAVNVTQDQRGVSRPQDGDGNGTATCDVGAYEAAAVQSFTLTVTGAGTGTGTVTSNPTGINCTITSGSASGECSENYTEGTSVTLMAAPNPGSTFAGWSGGCSGTNPTTNVTMNANKTCTATFQQVGTIVIQKMTIGGEGMFSFSATGMGLSNFSLTTSGGMASQTFSNIPAGTKTVTEAGPPAGWALASLVCTGDQDNGTMVDVAMRKATIDLDAGETVTCTFTNTRVGVSLWTLQDGDKCLTLDLGNKRYVFRTGNGRFGGAIEFTQTARAIRFRSVAGARPSLSGTINLTERAGTAVLALGLTRWITLVDRNLDDNGLCPP